MQAVRIGQVNHKTLADDASNSCPISMIASIAPDTWLW